MRTVILLSLLISTVGTSRQVELQPAQMQQDFDVLRHALEEAHGGLYRFAAKPDLDRQFDRTRATLDRPMSILTFAGIVSEALAYVRDGHMRLEYDDATNTALATARMLPLRVASEAGRIVVTSNDSAEDRTIRPGMELLSVNGRPMADITKTIFVGALRVRTFDGDTFAASLAAAFSALRERGSKAVVLDLRGNGGGVDQYGALLVSHFVSVPFRYFKHIKVTTIRPSFATWKASTFENLRAGTRPALDGGFMVLPALHPGVEEQKAAELPFLGRVFVLVDGGTFSTSADVCAQLRSLTKATFIGEETGGAFDGNTSGLNAQIVLPHSILKLKIQMYDYWNDVTGGTHGRGTLPDRNVLRTVDDVLAGTDSALDLAIALAAK